MLLLVLVLNLLELMSQLCNLSCRPDAQRLLNKQVYSCLGHFQLQVEKKRKDYTFRRYLTRSLVIYQAAQNQLQV